jgi:hypothetical protein
MKLLHRLPPTCPAQAMDTSHLDDFPDDATNEFRARRAGITKDGEFRKRPAQALNITKDGTPVLFQQSPELKFFARQFCWYWSKNDYAKCGAALKKIQKSTTAMTFAAIRNELDIPSWKYANYYIELYEYEKWRRGESFDYWAQKFCETCGKPLPDKNEFRKTVVRCLKQGFYILVRPRARIKNLPDVDYCLCKRKIISRLSSVRRRRSRVKRMVAFLAKVPSHKQKSKRFVLQRGDKQKGRSKQKALQRQMESEDLILWDTELYDSSGKPHCVEDVLDTPLIRDLINAKFIKREKRSLRERVLSVLSLLGSDDGSLVSIALRSTEPPLEPVEMSPDLKRLWRRKLDDEE